MNYNNTSKQNSVCMRFCLFVCSFFTAKFYSAMLQYTLFSQHFSSSLHPDFFWGSHLTYLTNSHAAAGREKTDVRAKTRHLSSQGFSTDIQHQDLATLSVWYIATFNISSFVENSCKQQWKSVGVQWGEILWNSFPGDKKGTKLYKNLFFLMQIEKNISDCKKW